MFVFFEELKLGKPVAAKCGKFRPTYLPLGGNDTVPKFQCVDLFVGVFVQCMEVGFLNKPTAVAYDGKLQLLAVGNKAGDIRMYSFCYNA